MALLTNINGKFSVSDAGAVTFNNAFTFPTADGTANYVLKTNGSGQLSWSPDNNSGTVKGTGTATRVAFWSASDTITSDADLYWDNTNKRLGIGVATPAALLEINGTGDAIRVESTNTGAGGAQVDLLHFSPSPADNDTLGYINMGGYYSGTSSAYFSSIRTVATDISARQGEIQFWTVNTTLQQRMVIDTDGNVGIGTDSPSAKLHIAGGSSGMFLSNLGDNSAYDSIKMSYNGYNSGTPEFIFTPTTTPGSGIANTWYRFKNTNGASQSSNNVANVSIDGSLGVGTTSPLVRLQLERTVSDTTSRTAPVNLIYLTSEHPSVGYGGFGTAITHYSRTYQNSTKTEQSKITFTQQGDSVSTAGSTIDFYTKTLSTGSAAPEFRMRINYNGNVGINETAPATLLSLAGLKNESIITLKSTTNDSNWTAGDVIGGINFRSEDGSGAGAGIKGSISYIATSSSGGSTAMTFNVADSSTNNVERVRIAPNGNVGIGEDNPSGTLDIRPNSSCNYVFDGTSTSGYTTAFNMDDTGLDIGHNSASRSLNLQTNSLDRLTILGGGNVGINNTAPTSKLNVNGNDNGSAEYSVTLGSTTTAGGTANNASSTPVNKTLLTGYSIPYSGQTNSRLTTCGFLEFASTAGWTGSQRTWAITSGYDIGGQDSGAGGNKMAIILGNAQNVSPQIGTNGAIGESGDGDGANSLVACYWDNALNMRLADSGRLYTGGGGSAALPMITPGTDKNTGIWYPTSDTWALSTAGAERIRINSLGNVGIGDTQPTSLSVNTSSLSVNSTRTDLSGALFQKSNGVLKFQQYWSTAGIVADVSAGDYFWKLANVNKMALDTGTGALTVVGDIVAYGSPSDKRLKENIKPIESALDKVSKLQGVTFDWKKSDSILKIKQDIGFIAQDVQKVVPELVRENENGMLSMRHQGIAPILLEAIKELKAEIEELKKYKCDCKK